MQVCQSYITLTMYYLESKHLTGTDWLMVMVVTLEIPRYSKRHTILISFMLIWSIRFSGSVTI